MFSEDSKAAVENYLKNEKFKKYMLINTRSSTIVLRSDDLKYIGEKAGEYHRKTGTPHLVFECVSISDVKYTTQLNEFKKVG